MAGVGTAAAGRRGSGEREGRLRAPDVLDVGGRPRGGPPRRAPALRLRRAARSPERPARLLQGPRLPARVRPLPRRRRALRGGVRDVPAVRLAARGASGARPPLGRRRDGLARAGTADRRRDGDRREEAQPPPVPRLGHLRRQRDGRGIDVGGGGARGLLRARQPHRDHRRQPARPARRDDARLGPLLVLAPARGVRLACDRDRRPRRRGDRRRLPRGRGDVWTADRDRRADGEGEGLLEGRERERLARQGGRRGGGRGARRRSQPPDRRCEAGARELTPLRDDGRVVAGVRGRQRRLDPQGIRRGARRTRRRGRRRSSCSTARSPTRPSPRSSATPTRSGSSRCTSRSSRWSRPRWGCRSSAGSRSARRSPPSSPARTTSCGWRP